MENREKRLQRAAQFAPFNALKGYSEMISDSTKVVCEKRELGEDDLQELSDKIIKVSKGMIVTIEFYDQDGYITKKGVVTEIDFVFRTITIIKTKIKFDDISKIDIV